MTHTRWIVGSLVLALGALGMGGCYYNFDHGGSGDTTRPSGSASSPPTYEGAPTQWTGQADQFQGDLGRVEHFDGGSPTITAYDYGNTSSSVRIDAENTSAQWWAMTSLSFSGSIHHASLVPGARFVFNSSSRPTVDAAGTALYVTALGCSGPRHGDYTFDHPASQVTVAVSAGPTADTRRMDFDAQFAGPNGEQHVTGSFVFDTQ